MTTTLKIKIPEDKKQDVENVCNSISDKDATFKYSIIGNYLNVYCNSKDEAHKKGYWFKHKLAVKLRTPMNYTVIEG